MKIFISYSTDDIGLVHKISTSLSSYSEVYYWAKDYIPGKEVWPTIFSWIDNSDLVIAVITDKTVSRAMSVGQEIGRAKSKNKLIIPLVEPNIPASELGCLSGVTYQPIQKDDIETTLQYIQRIVFAKENAKAEQQKTIFIALLLIILLFLASSE